MVSPVRVPAERESFWTWCPCSEIYFQTIYSLCNILGLHCTLHRYAVTEMLNGGLPWRKIKDKEAVGETKESIPIQSLLAGHPAAFLSIVSVVERLQYGERPDYELIIRILEEVLSETEWGLLGDEACLDWELSPVMPGMYHLNCAVSCVLAVTDAAQYEHVYTVYPNTRLSSLMTVHAIQYLLFVHQ